VTLLSLIFGASACLGLAMLLLVAFHNWAYKAGQAKGYTSGYEQGRLTADNWWIRAETEIDQARQKIWREEAQL
jgi:hypothetical protein